MQPFNKLALLALFLLAGGCMSASSQVVGPVNSNGGGSGNFSGPSSAVSGNFVSFADTTGHLGGDSGVNSASFAPAGLGSVVTTSQTPSAADWAAYKQFTINNSALSVAIPNSSSPALSTAGGYLISSPSNAFTITPNVSDTLNGGSAGVGQLCYFIAIVTTDASGHDFTPCFGTAASKNIGVTTLTISTATFTPTGATVNYKIALIHASCPCTLANPSAGFVAGDSGVIEVVQSSTGSDSIGTWGSDYIASGGTSGITLSTAAGAKDFIPYFVEDSTHILLNLAAPNATH